MTSAPITEIPVMPNPAISAIDKKGNLAGEESGFTFTDAMMQAGGEKTDAASLNVNDIKTSAGTQVLKQGGIRQSEAKGADKDVNATNSKDSDNKEIKEADPKAKEGAKDKLDNVEDEAIKEIAEDTGVSEEDVKAAMEVLGLSVLDLTDPANMSLLLNELTPESEPVDVLTDGALFDTVTELTADISELIDDAVTQISEEFNITEDEAKALLDDAVSEAVKTIVDDNEAAEGPAEDIPEVEIKEGVAAPVKDVDRNDKGDAPVRATNNTERAITNETVRVSAPEKNENAGAKNNSSEMFNDNAANANVVNNEAPAPEAHAPAPEVPFIGYSSVDAEDVISQIKEQVNITRSEGLTEMDITLNPASLGNVHLHLASREGAITATIAASNEAVRDVLVSQIMTLKESLNEQGLKVDAVEVTIASHEFERQMEGEGAGSQAKDMMEKEISRGQRRRLILNGLQDAEELIENGDLTDDEKLQVDMMARNGQTVDFSA